MGITKAKKVINIIKRDHYKMIKYFCLCVNREAFRLFHSRIVCLVPFSLTSPNFFIERSVHDLFILVFLGLPLSPSILPSSIICTISSCDKDRSEHFKIYFRKSSLFCTIFQSVFICQMFVPDGSTHFPDNTVSQMSLNIFICTNS